MKPAYRFIKGDKLNGISAIIYKFALLNFRLGRYHLENQCQNEVKGSTGTLIHLTILSSFQLG